MFLVGQFFHADLLQSCDVLSLGNTDIQFPPKIFYWVEVGRYLLQSKAWCFHLNMSQWIWCSWNATQPFLPPNTARYFYTKGFILDLSDRMTFSLSFYGKWSLENMKWAWTCVVLSRETHGALQDFNLRRQNVFLTVNFSTVDTALFRLLTSYLWAVSSLFSRLHEPQLVRSQTEPQVEGDWLWSCISSINNVFIAPTADLKLFAHSRLAHFSLV